MESWEKMGQALFWSEDAILFKRRQNEGSTLPSPRQNEGSYLDMSLVE